MAARLLARARANGKTVTPGNIAYYTMLHIRCGRRSHPWLVRIMDKQKFTSR